MQFETGQGPTSTTVIGGLFGLTTTPIESSAPAPAFLDDRNLFFANATSALAVLIDKLRPEQVWLPSYLCVALMHIYPPLRGSLSGLVPDTFVESHWLSLETMSLPCDQRYDERDIDRMIEAVRTATP
jgi:hypothetical protein